MIKMTEVPCVTLGHDNNYSCLANPTLDAGNVEHDESSYENDEGQEINKVEFDSKDNSNYLGVLS